MNQHDMGRLHLSAGEIVAITGARSTPSRLCAGSPEVQAGDIQLPELQLDNAKAGTGGKVVIAKVDHQSVPSILFLNAVDAIAPFRGQEEGGASRIAWWDKCSSKWIALKARRVSWCWQQPAAPSFSTQHFGARDDSI